ncbi:MAG: NAD(P)H-binding protein [Gloeomargarita sp. SKYBB_i_bin120]|nr:NAD(P)H-binding protein [Gloeomargarita sp. SKYG98]MCS7292099.1 NAD(P)H-binding protein [Gloeomargarita sp. SKYB120]MDW8177659.1 NAD(P)H-binding protein [Gloeomargarita sp. SKYBB_i_bin120]
MKILVVGATGTLGRQVVRRALQEGHTVRCLVRSLAKATFLREWGAELVPGNLWWPETLEPALAGMEVVIDAATARPTDAIGIREVDWQGKVSLIQAMVRAGVRRLLFFSILGCERYPQIPLMSVKAATEAFLAESGLDYTILAPAGFYQGLIGQFAIPILEEQAVWLTGTSTAVAYMDAQDVARLALRCLDVPTTIGQKLPVVGPRAWTSEDIIALCERLSGKTAKVLRVPLSVLTTTRQILRAFQWTWNIADRLAFAALLARGEALDADMTPVYQLLGLSPAETTPLEKYLAEYFARILQKLKERNYELDRQKRQEQEKRQRRRPFKASAKTGS